MACPTASAIGSPRARPAATAAERVQPVPWVFRVSIRGRESAQQPVGGHQVVDALATRRMAALHEYGAGPLARRCRPWATASFSLFAAGSSISVAVSGRFGVTRSASGRR